MTVKNTASARTPASSSTADGGIEIYIGAKKPEGVPDENWLPINREDIGMDAMFRIYAPDAERMKTWKTPQLEMLPAVN